MTNGGRSEARDLERFERAIGLIDAANAQDPNRLAVDGGKRPKENVHAEMMTRWIQRLRPDASEELLLAARAHHIRRWVIPRSSYSSGRRGYLQWRTKLHHFHADEVGKILREAGYEPEVIRRVQQIIEKLNLREDSEVQAFEDALCLVFLETQLTDLRRDYGDEKVVEVLRKTLVKMSSAGKALALQLELAPSDREILAQAVGGA